MSSGSNIPTQAKGWLEWATIRIVLLLAVIALCTAAQAQSKADCSTIKSKVLGRSVPYCVIVPASFAKDATKRYPVVYYLHGIGDNEQSLINLGGWNLYDSLVKKGAIGEMVLAAPMGYRSFYVNARNGKFNYEDFFFREFVPMIEAKYRAGGSRNKRALLGISMGGFGALHYAFEKPQMFASVVGIMPALMERLPENFGGAGEQHILEDVFGDASHPQYYDKLSVFTLAQQQPAAALSRMKISFNAGSSDDYGFFEGVTALDKLLTKRKIPHEAKIDPGRHSAQFALEHFGPALEWSWKAVK